MFHFQWEEGEQTMNLFGGPPKASLEFQGIVAHNLLKVHDCVTSLAMNTNIVDAQDACFLQLDGDITKVLFIQYLLNRPAVLGEDIGGFPGWVEDIMPQTRSMKLTRITELHVGIHW